MTKMYFTVSTVVNRSVQDAFDLLVNVNRHTELFTNTLEVRGYHGGQLSRGDRWVSVGSFMRRDIETHYRVLELTPPEKLTLESISSSAKGTATWTFEAVEGGTKITVETEGEPKGFFASVASSLLRNSFEKLLRDNMENIKAILES